MAEVLLTTPEQPVIERPKRPPGFLPGQSGNPSGRPKDPTREIAREYSAKAMETLYSLMTSSGVQPRVRVMAADIILKRAYGNPVTVELTGADGGPVLMAAVDAPPQETREQWIARKTKEILEANHPITN